MAVLTRNELRNLIDRPPETRVSVYLPTHRTGDIQEDPIRLKNMLREAEDQMVKLGLRSPVARDILEPARRLLTDNHFWQHQGDGLAIFAAPGFFQHYRLPTSFQELTVVNQRFHLKPLIPLLSDGIFYILAVSQKQVRFLQCTSDSVREVTPESVPESLAEALRFDEQERILQYHYHGSTGRTGDEPVFSHGVEMGQLEKDNILRYFQKIDRGLHEVLREERSPLIIAGVDYLHPIYRQASKYAYLMSEGIEGNPEGISNEMLHQKAWTIIKPYYAQERLNALNLYNNSLGSGLNTNDIAEAVPAAYDKRIAVLFVALGIQKWGLFDPKKRKVILHDREEPGDEDLLDFITIHALTNGGAVFAVEPEMVPGNAPLAALLRYPV